MILEGEKSEERVRNRERDRVGKKERGRKRNSDMRNIDQLPPLHIPTKD